MASNQTPYLNLCQWEADDEVLRADFNGDNAKIDAALAGVGLRLDEQAVTRQLVVSAVPEVGSNLLHLPLSGLDSSKWRRLVLYGQLRSSSSGVVYLNNSRRSSSIVNLYSAGPGVANVLANVYGVGASGGVSILHMEFDLCAPFVICRHYSLASSTGATNAVGNSGISLDRGYSWSSVREITIADAVFLEGSKFEVWLER